MTTGPRRQRKYTDDQVAEALVCAQANGGNAAKTARELGIPVDTVKGWLKGSRVTDDVEEVAERTKGEMAERLDDLAWRMIDIMPDKIEDAPLHHISAALSTCVDKARLLRNQPTDITDDYSNLTDEQRAARLAEIYDAARARRARLTPRRAKTADPPH